jgi:hypothetical protein
MKQEEMRAKQRVRLPWRHTEKRQIAGIGEQTQQLVLTQSCRVLVQQPADRDEKFLTQSTIGVNFAHSEIGVQSSAAERVAHHSAYPTTAPAGAGTPHYRGHKKVMRQRAEFDIYSKRVSLAVGCAALSPGRHSEYWLHVL